MTDEIGDSIDTDETEEICLEPLPPFADEQTYLHYVAQRPMPTDEQITDFVKFVAGAKSWYKHLPVRPPGAPMHFYLDPNAGRDRLRRWGHEVIYRDRTEQTRKIHYSWMTTKDYRRRFGYLAYSCAMTTGIWVDEMLEDGVATLDPNVLAPLVEGEAGQLRLVPEAILEAGGCLVTRTLHASTDAASLSRNWNRQGKQWTAGPDIAPKALAGLWTRIGELCEQFDREANAEQRDKAVEMEFEGLIRKQRDQDHCDLKAAIENMLGIVQR